MWKCKKCGEEISANVKAIVGVKIEIPVSLENMPSKDYFANSQIKEEIVEQADYTMELVDKIYDNEFEIEGYDVVNYECSYCEEKGDLEEIAVWREDE